MDQLLWERVQVVVSWERVKVKFFLFSFSSFYHNGTNMMAETRALRDGFKLCSDKGIQVNDIESDSLWWTPSLVLYPPLDMCFTWSENASAYCLLAWWFLTSIDKATQLQTDWLLMLTLTGLIASLKLLLLSCKQAYYNDKEGLYSYSCSRNAFFHQSHVRNRKRTTRTTKGLSILGVILTRKWWVSEFITFQAVSSV